MSLYGLLHFILAAYIYPSEESLSEDEEGHMVKVSAPDVARFAVEVCDGLKALAAGGEVFSEQAVEGFTHLLSVRESDSAGGRQNLVAMLRFILEKYADEGLLLRVEEQGEAVFRARPALSRAGAFSRARDGVAAFCADAGFADEGRLTGGGKLMARLCRMHFAVMGEACARFHPRTLDFRHPTTGAAQDSVLWLRNGAARR